MTASSPLMVRVAEAIATSINEGNWSAEITAAKTYLPGGDRTSVNSLIAHVIPIGQKIGLDVEYTVNEAPGAIVQVGIGFMGPSNAEDPTAEVEAVLNLADEILADLFGRQFVGLSVQSIDIPDAIEWDDITESGAVTHAVGITLIGLEDSP